MTFEITLDENTIYQAAERYLERLHSPNQPDRDKYSIELGTSNNVHSLAIYKGDAIIPCKIWQSKSLIELNTQINKTLV